MNSLEKNMQAWVAEGGEVARQYYRKTGSLTFKSGREAVTEADRLIETLLRERIGKAYPEDRIIGEEFGGEGIPADGRRIWQVDPIDGTLNFALGLPGFCTSLALMEGDTILAACVGQPLTGDSFTAIMGQGARLNDEPITVSRRQPLKEAVISTQFKKDGRIVQDPGLLQAITLAPLKCRRTGAIALELAWVAAGGYDALVGGFDSEIHLWDIAAGLLLVSEAGGKVTDLAGAEYQAGAPELLVSNGLIHQEIVDLFGAHLRDN